ncbi:MAG: AI-2E family transporter [Saprospiraceae bacterium]|nr:AI-2E family transporter [Saprospiraceae bacterium]
MPHPPTTADARDRVQRVSFFIALILVTTAFLGLVFDFLLACFWAAILAIIFKGVHRWMTDKWPERDNLTALATTLFIVLVVVTPVTLVSILVIKESTVIYQEIEDGNLQPTAIVDQIRERLPAVERAFERVGITKEELDERLNNFTTSIVQGAGDLALRYTQDAISLFIQFTLMLYLLFFFLRDGGVIMRAIQRALPLGDVLEEHLFNRFADVSRATLKGTVIVATIQGSIGGILFYILGIPGAVFWGVLMILLSLLPVGGSALVWFPAAVILFIQGDVTEAIVIVVVGVLIIGLIDNLLRPRLVSRDTKMPDYLILLATLGGLAWFGISGFIIGPVIAALFLTCWEITGQNFGENEEDAG